MLQCQYLFVWRDAHAVFMQMTNIIVAVFKMLQYEYFKTSLQYKNLGIILAIPHPHITYAPNKKP